jgi:hypothetical protein
MKQLETIEKPLEDLFKGLPVLKKETKASIAQYWPIVTLVLGILQFIVAWALWGTLTFFERVYGPASQWAQYYGGIDLGYSSFDRFVIYAGVLTLVVSGALMIAAYAPLKARLKKGWNLLFLSFLLNVPYAVLAIFMDQRGIGTFIFSLLGTAVLLYFLFQVKELYKK